MSSICSSRFRIPYASRVFALSLAALALSGPAAAQRDQGVVDALARLLAAADTRVYDPALFRETLRHPDPFVRRQAALAAGRIGDALAVDPLVAALEDSAPAVQAAVAFALGLLKPPRAVASLLALARAAPATRQGPPQTEAVTAIAKTGGDEAAAALQELLKPDTGPAGAVQRSALLEAWRLGGRAPIAALMMHARNTDLVARRSAIYALARLRTARGVTVLVEALMDPEASTRAVALRGLSCVLTNSAQIAPQDVVSRIRPLLRDGDWHVRVNALRALATFRDSALAALALPLATDLVLNVAVQALGAARDRGRLEAQLADLDGRVVVQALQALQRLVPDSDSSLSPRALLRHPDAAVRSVAADVVARLPVLDDVDRLAEAYLRAAADTFNDARLSAVAALAAIAATSANARAAVATRFVARVPRPDDYLVRRLAAAKLPEAATRWGRSEEH